MTKKIWVTDTQTHTHTKPHIEGGNPKGTPPKNPLTANISKMKGAATNLSLCKPPELATLAKLS